MDIRELEVLGDKFYEMLLSEAEIQLVLQGLEDTRGLRADSVAAALRIKLREAGVVSGIRADTPDELENFLALINAGEKIKAIKMHRVISGTTLVEAKNHVEHVLKAMRGDGYSLTPDNGRCQIGGRACPHLATFVSEYANSGPALACTDHRTHLSGPIPILERI